MVVRSQHCSRWLVFVSGYEEAKSRAIYMEYVYITTAFVRQLDTFAEFLLLLLLVLFCAITLPGQTKALLPQCLLLYSYYFLNNYYFIIVHISNYFLNLCCFVFFTPMQILFRSRN